MEFMLDLSHPVLPIPTNNPGSVSHTGLFPGPLAFSCYISGVSCYQSLLLLLPFQCHHNHHQQATIQHTQWTGTCHREGSFSALERR